MELSSRSMNKLVGQRTKTLPAHHFIALIHKEPRSGYGVSFPDLPGVIAVADSLDEALAEASSVLAFAFEDWHGAAPVPRSLDDLRHDPKFLSDSADAIAAAVRPGAAFSAAA